MISVNGYYADATCGRGSGICVSKFAAVAKTTHREPGTFYPDAQEKIEKAIVYFEWVRQEAKATKAAELGKGA